MANQQTSSSSSTSFTYDVCISYYADPYTRKSFASNLWHALQRQGIQTFMDDQEGVLKALEVTHSFAKVIQESKIAVIVLSENYFLSSICLEELAFIIDNFQLNNDHRFILLVFEDSVHPSRWHKQIVPREALYTFKRYKNDKERVKKWKNALSHVAKLSESDQHFIYRADNENEVINEIVKFVISKKLDHVPVHNATWQRVFNADITWRLVGLLSSVIGLICYALSPCFNRLFGSWKLYKFILYVAFSLGLLTTILLARELSLSILFAKGLSLSTKQNQLKKFCTIFGVLMIVSVYSFLYERAMNGKPDVLSVVSNAAFALVSLCLHRLFKFKSEIGVFSYFLCCFTVQLLTINWMWIFVAIIYGFLLSAIHFFLNSPPNVAGGRKDNQV